MIRSAAVFLVAAVLAALVALLVRSALHRPYDPPAGAPAMAGADGGQPTAAAVPAAPADLDVVPAAADPHAGHAPAAADPHSDHPAPAAADPHAGHAPAAAEPHPGQATPAAAVDPHAAHRGTTGAAPVNSICAICGMDVDPEIPTAIFRRQAIGFACVKCPPLFAADPERYGPSYLRNESLKQAREPQKEAP